MPIRCYEASRSAALARTLAAPARTCLTGSRCQTGGASDRDLKKGDDDGLSIRGDRRPRAAIRPLRVTGSCGRLRSMPPSTPSSGRCSASSSCRWPRCCTRSCGQSAGSAGGRGSGSPWLRSLTSATQSPRPRTADSSRRRASRPGDGLTTALGIRPNEWGKCDVAPRILPGRSALRHGGHAHITASDGVS